MHGRLSRREFTETTFGLLTGAFLGGSARPAVGGTFVRRPIADSWIPGDALVARIPALLEAARVSAVSIAVLEGGAPVWSRAFGVRAAGGTDPVTTASLFEAASLTKPVFAFLVLRMHDRGVIDLDRPLADYLAPPDLVTDPRARRITARHALSHSSGFRNWRFDADTQLDTAFEPGAQFQYSGEAYYWLQRVVETIVDQPWAVIMRREVLDPLAMRASRLTFSEDLLARLVSAHDENGAPITSYGVRLGRQYAARAAAWGKPFEQWRHEDRYRALAESETGLAPLPVFMGANAAGSLVTTAADYIRFLQNLTLPAPGNARGLRPETLQQMLSPQVAVRGPLSWGLGWGLERRNGRTMAWHWGDNVHFKTFVLVDYDVPRAIVLLTNGANGEQVYRPIVRDVLGGDLEAFAGV